MDEGNRLELIYKQLRQIGEVRCKLNDEYIDLRGHTVEYVDGFVWVDKTFQQRYSEQYFTNMVGDIWRLCK